MQQLKFHLTMVLAICSMRMVQNECGSGIDGFQAATELTQVYIIRTVVVALQQT